MGNEDLNGATDAAYLLACEEILATLDAAELQLRVLAATRLPFAAVARINRRSIARSREILARLGITAAAAIGAVDGTRRRTREVAPEIGTYEDDTEELLDAAVGSPVGAARVVPALPEPVPVPEPQPSRSVPLDDGPEGAAEHPPSTDERPKPQEEPPTSQPEPLVEISYVEESATDLASDDEVLETGGLVDDDPTQTRPRADVAGKADSLVSFDHESNSFVSYDDDVAPEDDDSDESGIQPRLRDEAPLVQFSSPLVEFSDDTPEDELSEEDEQEITNVGPAPTAGYVQFEDDDVPAPAPAPVKRTRTGPEPTETFDLAPDFLSDDDVSEERARRTPTPQPTSKPIPKLARRIDDDDVAAFDDQPKPASRETPVLAAPASDVEDEQDEDSNSNDSFPFRTGRPVAAARTSTLPPDEDEPRPAARTISSIPTPVAAVTARPAMAGLAPAREAPAPVLAGTPAARSAAAAGRKASGPAVPMIREGGETRPRSAAVQLTPQGQGKVLKSEEEDEELEMDAAEVDDDDGSEGMRVEVEEYEDDDAPELSEEEPAEPAQAEEAEEEMPPLEPVYTGPTSAEVAEQIATAIEAVRNGDIEAGIEKYSDILDASPDSVEAHIGRGRLYLDKGDYARAMSDFTVAEDVAPNSPEPQVAVGDLYFARKDYRKAIDYFNAALDISPNHAMAFCRRGISHYYRKNYQEAVDDLNKAQRLDRDIPNIQTYVSMAKKKIPGRK